MPRNNPHVCSDCGVALSRTYPYDLCPKHWWQRYHAPPGYNYFPPDAAGTNPARAPPETIHPEQLFCPGGVISAARE